MDIDVPPEQDKVADLIKNIEAAQSELVVRKNTVIKEEKFGIIAFCLYIFVYTVILIALYAK